MDHNKTTNTTNAITTTDKEMPRGSLKCKETPRTKWNIRKHYKEKHTATRNNEETLGIRIQHNETNAE